MTTGEHTHTHTRVRARTHTQIKGEQEWRKRARAGAELWRRRGSTKAMAAWLWYLSQRQLKKQREAQVIR